MAIINNSLSKIAWSSQKDDSTISVHMVQEITEQSDDKIVRSSTDIIVYSIQNIYEYH